VEQSSLKAERSDRAAAEASMRLLEHYKRVHTSELVTAV